MIITKEIESMGKKMDKEGLALLMDPFMMETLSRISTMGKVLSLRLMENIIKEAGLMVKRMIKVKKLS